jgi:hypothetical protein
LDNPLARQEETRTRNSADQLARAGAQEASAVLYARADKIKSDAEKESRGFFEIILDSILFSILGDSPRSKQAR